jgi:hypothetical protein
MQYERDHCKHEQQMNQEPGALEHDETAKPQANQHYCENKKHG